MNPSSLSPMAFSGQIDSLSLSLLNIQVAGETIRRFQMKHSGEKKILVTIAGTLPHTEQGLPAKKKKEKKILNHQNP
jgi:hypothetical protein